ncbi:dachshund 1 [Grus japonensis]|uniref:Dachshund 1 n=1 Tax=Grus japonensis TaxID=30415 RepID=A0ABC9W2U5_GRUJA
MFYFCNCVIAETHCLTAAAAAAAAATNAAIAEAMKVKKIKLEAMSNYHANNNQHGADSENGDLNSSVDEELSYDYGVLQTLMLPLPLTFIETEDPNCRHGIAEWGAGS